MKLEVNGVTVVTPGGNGGRVEFGPANGETGMAIVGTNRADIRFNGSALKLVAGPSVGAPGSENGVAITTAGNVGIGTVNPETKLHVEGAGFVVGTIKSTNQTALLALNSRTTGTQQIWTLESGIFGNTNMFGIYDGTAQKARLTIDKAGLVAVTALQINGGADLAEHFDVSAASASTGAVLTEIQP